MITKVSRKEHRKLIHQRVRLHVRGTNERPRLNVFRSLKHIYAQVIDDGGGVTLVSASTRDPEVRKVVASGGNLAGAKVVGKVIGERARAKGIEKVVFDRGGYKYHGRIKALADAAREAGLKF